MFVSRYFRELTTNSIKVTLTCKGEVSCSQQGHGKITRKRKRFLKIKEAAEETPIVMKQPYL